MSKANTCYHSFEYGMICMLNGCPCDDGYNGKECKSYIDKNDRPSPDHVFDLKTGEWKLRNGKIPTVSQTTNIQDSN